MNFVFDLGNVLINWDPRAAFRPLIGSDSEIDAFFERVGFFEWNACQDAGRSPKDALAAAPADAVDMLANYFDQFALTIAHKVPGSWEIVADLKTRGHSLYGLTNWAAETWPLAGQSHPELQDVFEDIVVSGLEGVIKPKREIYDLLCARNGLAPDSCLLVDDSPKNVTGAQDAGWQGYHFTNAAALRAELTERGFL